jgi:hypothetical protein
MMVSFGVVFPFVVVAFFSMSIPSVRAIFATARVLIFQILKLASLITWLAWGIVINPADYLRVNCQNREFDEITVELEFYLCPDLHVAITGHIATGRWAAVKLDSIIKVITG